MKHNQYEKLGTIIMRSKLFIMTSKEVHAPTHNLTIRTFQVDLHVIRPQYTEDQVSPTSFECVLDY